VADKMRSILDARRAVSKRQEAKASQQRATWRDCKLVREHSTTSLWRNGRVAEGAPLLRAYTLIAYRGFESLFLRQIKSPLFRGLFICGLRRVRPLAGFDKMQSILGAEGGPEDYILGFSQISINASLLAGSQI
jgi:hypothetical protein